MKVKEAIGMLHSGTTFTLVGAKTGKVLYNSLRNKNLDKFCECECADSPFFANIYCEQNHIIKCKSESVVPVISIFVSGM